ncbi:hypothetical protein RvY_07549 [Ramazzottius varieornatus]|uniref:Guanylate cyclase n=1 Tax=Ramazzottius varieornatus TaxID=947166 RepID=A0A1D1VC14_RAMVA|nr:hypothetical protein RvY_07549 [Ramazzottius varieornatus]
MCTHSRVCCLILWNSYIQVSALRHGYTNGEYVYLALDTFRDDILGPNGWKQNDKYDKEARSAYDSLIVLTLRNTVNEPRYQEFANAVRDTAARKYPLMTVVLNYYVASFYDSILLYALSVNETLALNHSIGKDNIDELAGKYWNRTFPGATGEVYINPVGDRNDDHAIYDLDPDGVYRVAAEFYGYKDIRYPNYMFDQVKPLTWSNPSNTPPLNEPICGYLGDAAICDYSGQNLGIALGVVGSLLLIGCIAGAIAFRILKRRAELAQLDVLGTWREVDKPQIAIAKKLAKEVEAMGSHVSVEHNKLLDDYSYFGPQTVNATFRGIRVIVRICEKDHVIINRSVLVEVKTVRAIQDDNVARLLGLCAGPQRVAVMYEYCAKGSLFDLLAADAVKLDWVFRFSIIKDIVNGLLAITTSPLYCHGRLTSRCVFIDGHFVGKVGDYGLPSFFARTIPFTQDSQFCASLLWTAPELLVRPFDGGTQEGDVYSFAIILQETIMRDKPYGSYDLSPEVIIAKLQKKSSKGFRPKVDASQCPPEISVLTKQCWANNPMERPRLAQIKSVMKESERAAGEQGSILDTLIRRMENYTLDLEHIVEEKAQQFLIEKEKSEALLNQILPRVVVEQLKRGEQVKPESFDSVTVFYTDIVSFTTLSSQSTPTEVVDLLNDLYTVFDTCIAKFDAYKVETIGDCYVVASGVPDRNGTLHAREICRLALHLLEQIKIFKIRHRPDEQLKVRLGAHTGSVVSGVVGLVMPRFCLFGETVTIANKMESTSQAMRIQISFTCEKLVQTHGRFDVEEREEDVRINEKLAIKTFWLNRELPS